MQAMALPLPIFISKRLLRLDCKSDHPIFIIVHHHFLHIFLANRHAKSSHMLLVSQTFILGKLKLPPLITGTV